MPRLDAAEPLGLELADFAHAIRTGRRPRSHAQLGVEIVRILEAAHQSLSASGKPVALGAGRDFTVARSSAQRTVEDAAPRR